MRSCVYLPLLRFPLFIILPPSLGPGPIGPDLEPIGGPPGPPLIIIGPPRMGGIPRIIPRIGPGGPPRLKINVYNDYFNNDTHMWYIHDFSNLIQGECLFVTTYMKGPPRPLFIIMALIVGLGPRIPGIPLMPLILAIPRNIWPLILPPRIFLFCLFSFFFPNPLSLASCK